MSEELEDLCVVEAAPDAPEGFNLGYFANRPLARRHVVDAFEKPGSGFVLQHAGRLTYVAGRVCDVYTLCPADRRK